MKLTKLTTVRAEPDARTARRAPSTLGACAVVIALSACGSNGTTPVQTSGGAPSLPAAPGVGGAVSTPVTATGAVTAAAGRGTNTGGGAAGVGTTGAPSPVVNASAAGSGSPNKPAAAGTGGARAGGGAGTAGSATASAAGSGAAAAAAGGATGASGSGANVALKDCKAEDGTTDPCGTYTTAAGTTTPGLKVQLGPLGGQMESNVGKGFENTVSAADMDRTPASCQGFVDLFAQDKKQSDLLLDVRDLDFALFTVYHPANWEPGKTYPIITWGNGTCAMPEGYGTLLRYFASYGYVVFAANSRQVSDLTISPKPMIRALDFAFAANEDASSPYYHKLDTTKVAALGHSQGGAATVNAANDPRVNAVIVFNGGTSASKTFLTISGDRDVPGIGASTAADLRGPMMIAPKAAFMFFHMVPMTGQFDGHLTLMLQPDRVGGPAVHFLDLVLKNDPSAKEWFVGANCKLCNMDNSFEFGQHGLD